MNIKLLYLRYYYSTIVNFIHHCIGAPKLPARGPVQWRHDDFRSPWPLWRFCRRGSATKSRLWPWMWRCYPCWCYPMLSIWLLGWLLLLSLSSPLLLSAELLIVLLSVCWFIAMPGMQINAQLLFWAACLEYPEVTDCEVKRGVNELRMPFTADTMPSEIIWKHNLGFCNRPWTGTASFCVNQEIFTTADLPTIWVERG